jgi:hypothetical protein
LLLAFALQYVILLLAFALQYVIWWLPL